MNVLFLFIAIGQSEAAGLSPGNEIHDQSKQYRQGKKHECKTREETKEGGSKWPMNVSRNPMIVLIVIVRAISVTSTIL